MYYRLEVEKFGEIQLVTAKRQVVPVSSACMGVLYSYMYKHFNIYLASHSLSMLADNVTPVLLLPLKALLPLEYFILYHHLLSLF